MIVITYFNLFFFLFVQFSIIGKYNSIERIMVSSDNTLYILADGSLYHYEGDGTLLGAIGGRGWGDYEFDEPCDVWGTPLDVYIVDHHNYRVQRYDRWLNYIQSFNTEEFQKLNIGTVIPQAVCVSQSGELFIVDSDAKRVLKYNANKIFEREFGSSTAGANKLKNPTDITITSENIIAVLDETRVVFFDTFGNYISSFTIENTVRTLHSAKQQLILTTKNAIHIVSLTGEVLFTLSSSDCQECEQPTEFRDGLLQGTTLYIATPTSIFSKSL